jgi:hypothetical protein
VGPRLAITTAKMGKIGAQARVVFTKPVSYVFETLRGSDDVAVKTIGPDNNLHPERHGPRGQGPLTGAASVGWC